MGVFCTRQDAAVCIYLNKQYSYCPHKCCITEVWTQILGRVPGITHLYTWRSLLHSVRSLWLNAVLLPVTVGGKQRDTRAACQNIKGRLLWSHFWHALGLQQLNLDPLKSDKIHLLLNGVSQIHCLPYWRPQSRNHLYLSKRTLIFYFWHLLNKVIAISLVPLQIHLDHTYFRPSVSSRSWLCFLWVLQ